MLVFCFDGDVSGYSNLRALFGHKFCADGLWSWVRLQAEQSCIEEATAAPSASTTTNATFPLSLLQILQARAMKEFYDADDLLPERTKAAVNSTLGKAGSAVKHLGHRHHHQQVSMPIVKLVQNSIETPDDGDAMEFVYA